MDILEVYKKRLALGNQIKELLVGFENETKMVVTDVDIVRSRCVGQSPVILHTKIQARMNEE